MTNSMSIDTLVITDLDGSFWDKDLTCHPSTFGALEEIAAREIPILAATGRRERSARQGLASNGLVFPAVLLNGALGVDLCTNTEFHSRPFTRSAAGLVVHTLAEHGLSALMYLPDGSVAGPSDVTTGDAHRATFTDDFAVVDPDEVAATTDILSFSMIGLPREIVAPVADLIPPELATAIVYQDHLYDHDGWGNEAWSVHIQPVNICKWDGIEAYLAFAGIKPERIIAIGDGTNDIEMLENADLGVGVAGGHDEALAVADVVIAHPSKGGWATVVDYL